MSSNDGQVQQEVQRQAQLQAQADVRVQVEGRVGCITLQRESALNALSHAMVLRIKEALDGWLDDDSVALVLIDAEGDKAFCAGGDVAVLYHQGVAGDVQSGRQFFRDEYRLNALIDCYPKPYVAFMDGFVMGGGIGISSHGSHRIVTERSQLALPECAIGLVPDVGSSHLLSRAPGRLGEYLGLTGERFKASDAIQAGFADVMVPSQRLSALRRRLIETGDVAVIDDAAVAPNPSALASQLEDINAVFGHKDLSVVVERLGTLDTPWAVSAVKHMSRSSPLSQQLTLSVVAAAREQSGIEPALRREYRIVSRAAEHGDFLEGVRAALIDKDRKPVWKYASAQTIPDAVLAQFAEAAPDGDLKLPQ